MDNEHLDYPASHSMDTYWFAIDRAGQVALFESGEAGAVPAEAYGGDDVYATSEQLARLLPRNQPLLDLQGRQMTGADTNHLLYRYLERPYSAALFFLSSLEPARPGLESGRAVQIPATQGVAVIWRNITQEEFEKLHASRFCQGCFHHYEDEDEEHISPSNLARFGFFSYSHLTDNWISGPYGRIECPAQPIHIDQLPPPLRGRIKSMRFDTLNFAETPLIQPVEHEECVSWESAWLAIDGRHIRSIPGKEEEYAEYYEGVRDEESRYVVEPPPEPPAK